MGLMDFLKKKSDSGLGADAASFDTSSFDLGNNNPPPSPSMDFQPEHNMPSQSMNFSSMNNAPFGQPSVVQPQVSQQGSDIMKDMQMISLKLDAIKSDLDAMNQRLKNIEAIAEREQQQSRTATKKWY